MKSAFHQLIVTAAIELLTCTAALAQEQGPTVAVAITAPANGAVVTAAGDVEISAAANINRRNWAIVRVTFYADTQFLGTATAAPYRVTWTGVPAGRYVLTARAVATNAGQGKQDAATHRNMPTWEGVSRPVNLIVNESASRAQVYYIHTDHLNTPRLITNEAGQAVWRWDNAEPFGNSLPNENPSGLGNFTCNLRFPGQYFDKETNLHYNMARDYDPAIGRYIQSDPIGLSGGVNTYGYVDGVGIPLGPELNTYQYARGNPLRWSDPTGLDVTITYFPGGPGHIGIGVNSPNTSGLYPQRRSAGMVICRDVPGVVVADQERQDATSRVRSRSVTIRTTSAQDAVVQSFIDAARNNAQQQYNLCSNQCTGFVRNALRAGGVPVPGDSNSIVPLTYFEQVENAYGRQQR